jgi:hypothetical protein
MFINKEFLLKKNNELKIECKLAFLKKNKICIINPLNISFMPFHLVSIRNTLRYVSML